MIIAGVQPLSLIDYPGLPCSIIFTQGCVFRCSYCHNPELIPIKQDGARSAQEVFDLLKRRKDVVDAVCISGGEPTIQTGLVYFIQELKRIGFFVKLDTNGICPDVVEKLIADNLIDYIAMDVKAPWSKYLDVINIKDAKVVTLCKQTFDNIQKSTVAHEFRTTVLPGVHTDDDFFEIAGYLRPGEQYFIQKTCFKKTFKSLQSENQLDIADIVAKIKKRFSDLRVEAR